MMARETGLEPAASAVTGRRSNQLSYSRGCRRQILTPRRTEGIKGCPDLVKAVADPPVRSAFLRFRCGKMPVLPGKRRSQSTCESFKACCSCISCHLRGGPNMAKKAAAPATVTLKHLAAALSEEHELSKKSAESILTDLVTRITKHLKKGERVRIVGLGILQVRKRAARMGRNPATGEQIQIKASKKVAFRAAKELKEAV